MDKLIILVGRIFMGAIFLKVGIDKIFGFSGTAQFMSMKGMPLPEIFLVAAIVLEIIGGISLILGYKVKWSALALFIYLIPTTLIFHHQLGDQIQNLMFFKNLAIMGGLLFLVKLGAGDLSLDEKLS